PLGPAATIRSPRSTMTESLMSEEEFPKLETSRRVAPSRTRARGTSGTGGLAAGGLPAAWALAAPGSQASRPRIWRDRKKGRIGIELTLGSFRRGGRSGLSAAI